MRTKPVSATPDKHWSLFEEWADNHGVPDNPDDWMAWWDCWNSGFRAAKKDSDDLEDSLSVFECPQCKQHKYAEEKLCAQCTISNYKFSHRHDDDFLDKALNEGNGTYKP